MAQSALATYLLPVRSQIGRRIRTDIQHMPNNEDFRVQRDAEHREDQDLERRLSELNPDNPIALFLLHERAIARIGRDGDRLAVKQAFFEGQLIETKANIGAIVTTFEAKLTAVGIQVDTKLDDVKREFREDIAVLTAATAKVSDAIHGAMRTFLFMLVGLILTGTLGAVIAKGMM